MAVRMVHPLHGTTHAAGAEVAWNQANGWRIEPAPVTSPIVEPEPARENVEPIRKTITVPKSRNI